MCILFFPGKVYTRDDGPHPTCKCLGKTDGACADVMCAKLCFDDFDDDVIDAYCYDHSTCICVYKC